LNIQKQDIDVNKRVLVIPKTKNKTSLVLPLVGEAYELVKDLCSKNTGTTYVFPGHEKRNGGWNHYASAFDYAVKRAGISDCSFHTLRHTAASYMIQAGVPLYTVGMILNHKTIAMTARYAHLNTENLRDALSVLANRLAK
jgi:integrase